MHEGMEHVPPHYILHGTHFSNHTQITTCHTVYSQLANDAIILLAECAINAIFNKQSDNYNDSWMTIILFTGMINIPFPVWLSL